MDDLIIGSMWKHYNGQIYTILMFTNEKTNKPDIYPPTVVYQNFNTSTLWSRSISDWHRSMTLIDAIEL